MNNVPLYIAFAAANANNLVISLSSFKSYLFEMCFVLSLLILLYRINRSVVIQAIILIMHRTDYRI